MTARGAATLLSLFLGLAALLLQFSLTIPARLANGDSLPGALLFFFTFFTILTNLMLVLIYLSDLARWRWLTWWRNPVTRGMMFGAITLVMGFYHLILAATWDPQGWFKLADVMLHYITPSLYILWWLLFQPKGRLRFTDLGWMLLPPTLWLGWTMLRGAVINEYPYPILEAHRLGYPAVALNILAVLALLLILFTTTIALDRLLAKKR
ncbi:MAG TPA: Pr6Pr family membrane protein [Devosia sp.]|nr:Pr6Pr family membrane protein [Devosia sp.]